MLLFRFFVKTEKLHGLLKSKVASITWALPKNYQRSIIQLYKKI